MTPESLLQRGFLLCLDVPEGTEFGIDLRSWNTGPRFKGIKAIPPGPHVIYFSVASTASKSEFGARSSAFLTIKPGQVVVKKWNPRNEEFFYDQEWDQDERDRYARGVRNMEFDSFLAVYPEEDRIKWQTLSGFITSKILDKLEPVGKILASEEKSASKRSQEHSTLLPSQTAFYTKIPARKALKSATPQDVTRANFDKSDILEDLLAQEYLGDADTLMGEFQYAFITFLIGQSLEGFEQWKAITVLLCNCERALTAHPALFLKFTDCLRNQFEQVPEDFFIDPLSNSNFLVHCLKGFFEIVFEPSLDVNLQNTARRLQKLIEKRFAYSFAVEELQNAEDAPQIVEQ